MSGAVRSTVVLATRDVLGDLRARNLAMALALESQRVTVLARRDPRRAGFGPVAGTVVERLEVPDILGGREDEGAPDARAAARTPEAVARATAARRAILRRHHLVRRAALRRAAAHRPRATRSLAALRMIAAGLAWRASDLAVAAGGLRARGAVRLPRPALPRPRLPRRAARTRGRGGLATIPADAAGALAGLADLEVVLGRRLDDLSPDAIWTLDPSALVVAARARIRARARGVPTRLVHVLGPGDREAPELRAALAHADAVVEHADRPGDAAGDGGRLALDLPMPFADLRAAGFKTLGQAAAAAGGAPLVATLCLAPSSPGAAELVGALEHLPEDVHVALVVASTKPVAPWIKDLVAAATRMGARGRLHVVRAPDPDLLARHLGDAAAGYVAADPPRGGLAPELVAFLAAGVPLVLGHGVAAGPDLRARGLARTVDPADPRAIAEAAAAAVGDPHALGPAPDAAPDWRAATEAVRRAHRRVTATPDPDPGRIVLGVGPRNGNGQAWAWTRALMAHAPHVRAEVFAAEFPTGRLEMRFDADVRLGIRDWKHLEWQLWWSRFLLGHYSHLLLEQGLAACGRLFGKEFFRELPVLHEHGRQVALVFRGSEIRDPRAHAEREPWSPFRDGRHPLTGVLQERVDELRAHVEAFGGHKFVTTLDLVDDVPGARWLPHVLDLDLWHPGPPVFDRDVPVVLHAPSREQMKGSNHVDAVCVPLAEAGLIRYERLRGVPYREMPARLREADVLVDQFAVGSYGVLALQAMASGRTVVGHVAERVRGRLPDVALPVVEATPDSLRDVLLGLLEDRDAARAAAAQGPVYARRYHDGAESAARLATFALGTGEPSPGGVLERSAR